MSAHFRKEEEVLLPVLARYGQEDVLYRKPVVETLRQHARIRGLVMQLRRRVGGQQPATRDAWRDRRIPVLLPLFSNGGRCQVCGLFGPVDSYGVTLAPHWFHDLHVHLVAAAPNGRFVEYFPDDQVLNFRRLIDRQLEVRDGELALPTSPGLGFNFHEETVANFSQEGWQ